MIAWRTLRDLFSKWPWPKTSVSDIVETVVILALLAVITFMLVFILH